MTSSVGERRQERAESLGWPLLSLQRNMYWRVGRGTDFYRPIYGLVFTFEAATSSVGGPEEVAIELGSVHL